MKTEKIWWTICVGLFACYMIVLLYLVFFSSGFRVSDSSDFRYNLKPFTEIHRYLRHPLSYACFINVYGNILAFVPFGVFLLPVTKGHLKLPFAILACLGLTVFVETIQLLTHVGIFDVDDILLNFIGGLLGIGLFLLGRWIVRRIASKRHPQEVASDGVA